MAGQDSDFKQLAQTTMGAASGCGNRGGWLSRRRVRQGSDGGRSRGGRSRGGRSSGEAEQRTCLLELGATSGTPDAVVTDLGTTAGQGVQEEAVDKLLDRESDAKQLLAAVVTITKSDLTILESFQPAVA